MLGYSSMKMLHQPSRSLDHWQKIGKKEGAEIDFTGAVLDEKFLSPSELKPLESLPTKMDLIQKIAVGLKQVPTKVARGTKQIPSRIGYGVRAIANSESDLISE